MTSYPKKIKRPFVVSVEGNIGSGKSSFLKHFQSQPGVKTYSVCLIFFAEFLESILNNGQLKKHPPLL